jgi:hypothetical protein
MQVSVRPFVEAVLRVGAAYGEAADTVGKIAPSGGRDPA